MRLILRKEVENLGEVGDVVEVSDGYGLNHLIPKGFAIHATASTVRASVHEQRLRQAQMDSAKRSASDFAVKFEGVGLEFEMRAGEDGRLFGSVTNRDIERALEEKGIEVNRRRILLEEPIRKVGEYEVPIRLHSEVKASVQVHVVAADLGPEGPGEEGDGGDEGAAEASAAGATGEKEEEGEPHPAS